ncbi:hypothetical protein GE061_000698 [Apolygus lucorum]|uniref:Vitellogenin n=1 Tax=Apolygus lucorum TaxID=248454 RepID=A0A8S9Y525_APOLU|nr:hypothetical protein GE061_000698 [Apolygus lucorum]
MQWTPFLLLVAVGLTAAEHGWKSGSQYKYQVRGRSMAGLQQVADQYVGIVMKAKLQVTPKSDSELSLQVQDAQYADVHANLTGGWNGDIPEEKLHYQQLPINNKPFELKFKNGVVDKMVVDKNLPTWELNMLKAIASQLQVDTKAENLKSSRINSLPNKDQAYGVYKTMEDTVAGEVETIYDISPLPQYVIQSRPQLAPLPKLRGDGQLIDIVKTRNFSNAEQRMAYHYGFTGLTDWEPASNQMGNFLSRSSVSRVIISGSLERYTIQSSVTTDKIAIAPHLYNNQKGVVGSRMNLTLESVNPSSGSPSSVQNPRSVKNLVYEYNAASQQEGAQNHNAYKQYQSSEDSSSRNSIQASKQIDGVQIVQKLAKQIGAEVQQPNAIPGDNTLSKFEIMARVIRTMSADQLKKATEHIYYPYSKASPKSSQDAQSYQAWTSFRDAVAQAGTGPALLTLKDWIKSGKVEGQEAAELVSAVQNTARTPTPEYMDAFFNLATSEEACRQWFLNTSAILSFSNLVRKAQVNNDTAHTRYPSHVFGRLYPRKQAQKAVAEKYIPYLQNQLRKAVSQSDSPKIQVYIRALGNMAHPKILSVFEPYLEGKEPMSDFQRLTIVASMDKMTKTYPKLARSVLFKIYQNAGDAPEVRVAAVMQLMKTNPPAQILQRMAENTNSDHSKQVNSAVKSAIESAARLRTPSAHELAQNAKSAVNMLTPKNYGAQYSKNALRSYIVQEQQLGYQSQYTNIQSGDSILPSSMFWALRKNLGGYKRQEFQASYMTSSADDLMDLLCDQFESQQESSSHKKSGSARRSQPSSGSSHWSVDKVANMLNIETDDAEQLEGNVLISALSGKKFFAFDNHTIEQLPRLAKKAASKLREGQHFNYTKMYNQFSAKIGFPTATGLPFVFSFTVPTYAYVGGSIQAKSHPDISDSKDSIKIPKSINASADVEITYSAKAQGKMGFVTPYNHKRYTAALHKNIHVHVPLRVAFDIDVENNKIAAKVQPLDANHKHKLFEYSTVAYTAKHDILDMQPELNANNDVEIVHVRSPRRNETTVGQDSTGFAFDVKVQSEQKFLDWATPLNALRRHDAISALLYTTAEKSINNNNVTITYNPEKSSAKSAQITASYDSEDETNNSSGESGNHQSHNKHRGSQERGSSSGNAAAEAAAASSSPDSAQRKEQFLRKAGAGIQDSYAQMVDMSIQFNGEHKAQYVATAAYASSGVSEKNRFLFYIGMSPARNGKDYQIALDVEAKMPNVPLVNYRKALEADASSHISAQLNFGEKGSSGAQVSLQGKLVQTSERRDYVRHHPVSALCEQQMQQGNYIQQACRNATAAANMLDQYRFTINYEKVPESVKNATYKAYALARYFGNLYVSENIVNPNNKQGQVEIQVNLGKDLQSVNVSMAAPAISASFQNVPLNPYVAAAVAVHPEYNAADRVGQHLLLSQQFPTCSIDKNQATSFDNKSYPINLGGSWHVMAYWEPKSHFDSNSASSASSSEQQAFTILVRQSGSDKKEIIAVLGNDIVEILPQSEGQKAGIVKFNGKKATFDAQSSDTFQDENGNTVIQVFALPDGTVRVLGQKHGLEIMFDGQRVKLQVSNSYRGQMRGLCGVFDGEPVNDFTSPKNCILRNPYEFAASYAIPDSSLTSPAKELRQKAENADCYRQTVMLGDVISENEAGRSTKRSSSKSSNSNRKQEFQNDTRPQLSCQSQSQEANTAQKNVDFHCVSDATAAKRWEDQIKRGASPDFSKKGANYKHSMKLPSRCNA